ncbi:MAG: transcriptional repressor [Bacteroidota bacterium]
MKRRNTPSKRKILEILKEANSALSHDMIQARLDASIDRATIYRILNRFCEDGQAHKVIGGDGKQYFACGMERGGKHKHHHFHFKCLSCGKVECLENEIQIELPEGYVAEKYNALISGRCKSCT